MGTKVSKEEALQKYKHLKVKPPFWDELTQDQKDGFTMGGKADVVFNYYLGDMPQARSSSTGFFKSQIDNFIHLVKDCREPFNYKNVTLSLYNMFETKYPIKDKDVLIIGSTSPRYEAIALAYDGKPTTIDYNKIRTDDPRLKTYTVEEFSALSIKPVFDAAISISSIEHSGLGRYGDEIDPDADIKTMASIKTLVKKGGLLYLSVPYTAKDRIEFNACRIYGKERLPKLFEGWDLIDSAHYDPDFDGKLSISDSLFILENQ